MQPSRSSFCGRNTKSTQDVNQMGKIRELTSKLQTMTPSKVEELVLQAVKENENAATSANTDQLFSGVRSDGEVMPPYSRQSVEVFGKPDGPIRLFDTGDFYKGFFLHTEKFPILFDSKDDKTVKLTVYYGTQIFGLTKENFEDFAKSYVLPDLAKRIKEFIQL